MLQITIDISVIELHRIEQHGLRSVMEELGTFVEERRVILIAFNDEEFAFTQLIPTAEVATDTTHQHARLMTGLLQHPGEERGRGRLAMRAGNNERAFAYEE